MLETQAVAGATCGSRVRHRNDVSGQAMAEFAVMLPLVAIFLALAVEVAGVALDYMSASQHARHVVRSEVVAVDGGRHQLSLPRRLDPQRLRVDVIRSESTTEAKVQYISELRMPLSGHVLLRQPLDVHAVMWNERAP